MSDVDFDLDSWIDGTCGLTKTARILQRGDLLAEMEKLERELQVAKDVPKDQRGVNDLTPDSLAAKWEALAEKVHASALTLHIQDRTDARRRAIRDRLLKSGLKEEKLDDVDTIGLHVLADAIVKVETPDGRVKELPEGFPPEKLRALRDRLGDAALFEANEAFREVIGEAPHVSAPLSRRSSSGRSGRT